MFLKHPNRAALRGKREKGKIPILPNEDFWSGVRESNPPSQLGKLK